jgi:hypothetical protein
MFHESEDQSGSSGCGHCGVRNRHSLAQARVGADGRPGFKTSRERRAGFHPKPETTH